jgi:hypothetical protein
MRIHAESLSVKSQRIVEYASLLVFNRSGVHLERVIAQL